MVAVEAALKTVEPVNIFVWNDGHAVNSFLQWLN